MRCRALRRALDSGGVAVARQRREADHLAVCSDCRTLVERLEATRGSLGKPHAEIVPPPGFAARLIANLPRREEVLGWAALRLLPASLLIALTAGYLLATTPSPLDLPPNQGSDSELLVWLLFTSGGAP